MLYLLLIFFLTNDGDSTFLEAVQRGDVEARVVVLRPVHDLVAHVLQLDGARESGVLVLNGFDPCLQVKQLIEGFLGEQRLARLRKRGDFVFDFNVDSTSREAGEEGSGYGGGGARRMRAREDRGRMTGQRMREWRGRAWGESEGGRVLVVRDRPGGAGFLGTREKGSLQGVCLEGAKQTRR